MEQTAELVEELKQTRRVLWLIFGVVLLAVGFLLVGCNRGHDPLLSSLVVKPTHDKTIHQGADCVRNLLFSNASDGLFDELVGNLEKSGILDGGRKDRSYTGELFILDSMKITDACSNVTRKVAYVFNQEESALIVYEGDGWVVVEIIKW